MRVIVAGLDQDYLGKPFDPMPQLLAIAEYITKTRAICMVCGNPANHTQRLVASSDRVLLGAQGIYEARCRHCFDPTLSREDETKRHQGSRREGVMTLAELAACDAADAARARRRLRHCRPEGRLADRSWWRRRRAAIVAWPAEAAVLRHQPRDWHAARRVAVPDVLR